MDINSQIIFDTLKKQNILKSELKYTELANSKLNILIKKKVNGQWMYYVDLWQSFFNLNQNYWYDEYRPQWIDDLLIDNQNGYSSEINDAAIYKNFKLFDEYFLTPNYEVLVDDFYNKSDEYNLDFYGSKNPLQDFEPFEILTLSDYQLKKELAKYKNQTYKNLADYYIKTYETLTQSYKKDYENIFNRIKRLEARLTKSDKYKFMSNDSRIHDTIDQLIGIINDNYKRLYEQEIELPFPSEEEYSTNHLTKLY